MERANGEYMERDSNELGINYALLKDIATRCGFQILELEKKWQKDVQAKKEGDTIG